MKIDGLGGPFCDSDCAQWTGGHVGGARLGCGHASRRVQADDALRWAVAPTSMAFAPDGSVFITEKRGIIKAFSGLSDTSATTTLDLRRNVHNWTDRGMGGIVVDPQYPTRPYVYFTYTLDAVPGGQPPRWGGDPGQRRLPGFDERLPGDRAGLPNPRGPRYRCCCRPGRAAGDGLLPAVRQPFDR